MKLTPEAEGLLIAIHELCDIIRDEQNSTARLALTHHLPKLTKRYSDALMGLPLARE